MVQDLPEKKIGFVYKDYQHSSIYDYKLLIAKLKMSKCQIVK